jgi:RNA polymerase sigma-70 factor, ECF subfamily
VEPDDFALMEEVRADREGAFDALVRRYQRRLYRLAYGYLRHHEDALDAVQETLVKIYVARAGYRPKSHPFTWASRILVNHCIDRVRQRRARPTAPLQDEAEGLAAQAGAAGSTRDDPYRDHERALLRRRVEAAVASLPETQRVVFLLRHFEEMSLQEIAAARGCALGTVKSSLHRAALAVREFLSRGAAMEKEKAE